MTNYIATFHTHLSAMRTQRALAADGVVARLAPVPRKLSASCGTCVRYSADDPHCSCLDADYEKLVELLDESTYTLLSENI
ncbi:MAG: DUF3343 domain-containing protein [Clostridia bacterium]